MPDNYEIYQFDFEQDDFFGIAQDAADETVARSEEISEDALNQLEDYYQVDEEFEPDPIAASQRDGIDPEDMPEVQAGLVAHSNYALAQGQALKIDQQFAENSKIAAVTMQKLAQRDVILAQTTNEHKKLLLTESQGRLIDQKTIGTELQGVTQQVLNSREFQTIQLEMDKTEAIVDGKVQEIRSIRAASQAKALESYANAMKSMGIDVSAQLPQS